MYKHRSVSLSEGEEALLLLGKIERGHLICTHAHKGSRAHEAQRARPPGDKMSMGTIGATAACEQPLPTAKELGNPVRRQPVRLARLAKISMQKAFGQDDLPRWDEEEDSGTGDKGSSGSTHAMRSPVHPSRHSVDEASCSFIV